MKTTSLVCLVLIVILSSQLKAFTQNKAGEIIREHTCVMGEDRDLVFKLSDSTFITLAGNDMCQSQVVCYNTKMESVYTVHTSNSPQYTPDFSVNGKILTVIDRIKDKKIRSIEVVNYNTETGEKIVERKLQEGKDKFYPSFSDNGKYILLSRSEFKRKTETYFIQIYNNELEKVADFETNYSVYDGIIDYKVGDKGEMIFLLKPNQKSFRLDVYNKIGARQTVTYNGVDLEKREKFHSYFLKCVKDQYLLATYKYYKNNTPKEIRVVKMNPSDGKTEVFRSVELIQENAKNLANYFEYVWFPKLSKDLGDWKLRGNFEIFDCIVDSSNNIYVVSEEYFVENKTRESYTGVDGIRSYAPSPNDRMSHSTVIGVEQNMGSLIIAKFNSKGDHQWNSIFFKKSYLLQSRSLIHFASGSSHLKSDLSIGKDWIRVFSVVPDGIGAGNIGAIYQINNASGKVDKPILLSRKSSYFNAALTEWITPNRLILFSTIMSKDGGLFSPLSAVISSYSFKPSIIEDIKP